MLISSPKVPLPGQHNRPLAVSLHHCQFDSILRCDNKRGDTTETAPKRENEDEMEEPKSNIVNRVAAFSTEGMFQHCTSRHYDPVLLRAGRL